MSVPVDVNGAAALGQRTVPDQVEYHVVAPAIAGEVFPGVVDDVIRADRPDELNVSCAAHAGHVRAERLGDLYGERAHATRRAVDQDMLSWLYPRHVTQAHEGSVAR
jgi:hypothetical protein